jgi:hypothetical protein
MLRVEVGVMSGQQAVDMGLLPVSVEMQMDTAELQPQNR